MHSLGCCAGVAGLFKPIPNLGIFGGVCYMGIFAKQQWHCPPGSSRVNLIFAISVPATQEVGCTADLPCCRYKNTRFVQFGS
jgi:hypothetical protein